MARLLAIFVLLVSCGRFDRHKTESVPSAFAEKVARYREMTIEVRRTCDWLLFEALREAALNVAGPVYLAEKEPGQWFRTPAKDCFATGQSASDISRDMLLGLAVLLWQMGDAGNAQEVVAYADAHDGTMGEGDSFRTDIRPVLYATYQGIVKRAQNASVPLPPRIENPDPNAGQTYLAATGFEAHLLVLHIYLRGLIYGSLSDFELNLLKGQVERQPRNGLFQAVFHKFQDGQQDVAISVLMDEHLFPADSLPTNDNYCDHYIWQRDDGEDWQPCDEVDQHSGADFLFVASIIQNGFREGAK